MEEPNNKLNHHLIDAHFKLRAEPTLNWDVPRDKFFYCLCMFPYPSGQLHMGHVRNYTLGDVISRYKRMNGYQVFHPIGWDAFGLPAENAAIKHDSHPAVWTENNIEQMRSQLKSLGIDYHWSHELQTNRPDYYKWQQKLFLQMYHKGLVARKRSSVNWDPIDQTVLANEQVIGGRGWRSGALVEQREIHQWFLKITDYADRLLEDLNELEGKWPDSVLQMQRNWIGRSQGHEVCFHKLAASGLTDDIIIYTTRLETIMGVVGVMISVDHPIAKNAKLMDASLAEFINEAKVNDVSEASLETAPKKGYKTSYQVIHPLSGMHVDVWVVNYVLMEYGTGAVMCVPAHCDKDKAFAENYLLEPIDVLAHDKLINSGKYTGHTVREARTQMADDHPSQIHAMTRYRIRDWGVSRQRYWGCPIPMIHCDNCGIVPVPESSLPVVLPTDVPFRHDGSTLQFTSDFYHTTCPECGIAAHRETDTFDTFFDSSWYFMRFLDPHADSMVGRSSSMPVDLYIGGVEHAIMHLLYARFITKVLYDFKVVPVQEPFKALLTQGMVLNDGCKMSKSKGNTIEPTAMLDQYGVDSVRLFMMFAAPPEQSLEWSEHGLEGMNRFCQRMYRLSLRLKDFHAQTEPTHPTYLASQALLKTIHRDYETYSFNTVISSCMKWLNLLQESMDSSHNPGLIRGQFELLLLMLSPIAPGLTEHLWKTVFKQSSDIHQHLMPITDLAALSRKKVTWVVQVNGKKRALIETDPGASEAVMMKLLYERPEIVSSLANKTVKKTIVVQDRLLNIVVSE